MVIFYAHMCERYHKNFNTYVAELWKEDTKAKIIADGYVIADDGTVTKKAAK